MSIQFCPECYLEELFEPYPFLRDTEEYQIYKVSREELNSESSPYLEILAATDLKNIFVREDLKGRYANVIVRKQFNRDGDHFIIEEMFPVDLFDFSLYHEAEHIKDPKASEDEINRRALEKYITYHEKGRTKYIV